jgi:hypothetical protein
VGGRVIRRYVSQFGEGFYVCMYVSLLYNSTHCTQRLPSLVKVFNCLGPFERFS